MSGTKAGGAKTAATNKAKYGDDYYVKIGAQGGKASNTGGFQKGSEVARMAGSKGGKISKRGKADGK